MDSIAQGGRDVKSFCKKNRKQKTKNSVKSDAWAGLGQICKNPLPWRAFYGIL